MGAPGFGVETETLAATGAALGGDADAMTAAGARAGGAAARTAGACGSGALAATMSQLQAQLEGRARHLASALDAAGAAMSDGAGSSRRDDDIGARAFGRPPGPGDRA